MSISTCQEVFPECVCCIFEVVFFAAGSETSDGFSLYDSFLRGDGVARLMVDVLEFVGGFEVYFGL